MKTLRHELKIQKQANLDILTRLGKIEHNT